MAKATQVNYGSDRSDNNRDDGCPLVLAKAGALVFAVVFLMKRLTR